MGRLLRLGDWGGGRLGYLYAVGAIKGWERGNGSGSSSAPRADMRGAAFDARAGNRIWNAQRLCVSISSPFLFFVVVFVFVRKALLGQAFFVESFMTENIRVIKFIPNKSEQRDLAWWCIAEVGQLHSWHSKQLLSGSTVHSFDWGNTYFIV